MNILTRLVSLGGIAAGLCLLPLKTFAVIYSTSGTAYTPLVSQNWTVVVPAAVNISTTISATVSGPAGTNGGGSASVSRTSSPSASIYAFSASGPARPAAYTNSASASNKPAGTYYVYHSYGVSGGAGSSTYANISTTLTW